jgi:flagellar hook protein FlgE
MAVGFTGIDANSVSVNTVGDNLANLNTTAFKFQRTLLETVGYRTVSEGEAPDSDSGGTLPLQIGLGTKVSTIQRNFEQGSLQSTGFENDLAVDGDGFFILEPTTGELVYTRDGAFDLDATQTLVSASGAPVQVFPADGDGNIDTDTLSDLVIPIGTASQAIPTTEVLMDGRLDSGTNVASAGAMVTSEALVTTGGSPATAATALTDLTNAEGLPLLAAGDVLTVNGTKGGIAVAESTFIVGTTGSTLGDFAAFLEGVLGINTDPATGGTPGVTISDGSDAPAGSLVIRSNSGEINAAELDAGSVTNTTGQVTSPFTFATVTPAVGEGITTSFNVFDSLGNPVDVRLRMALESKSETGITWRFYAESVDDSDLSPVLGTGTLTFDANGQFVGATGTDLTIDRAGVGSVSPLAFRLDFSDATGLASTDGSSELVMASQDGAPAGILTGYSIDPDGIVTVTYSNQLTEVIAQIALATFRNDEGLVALSENTFTVGPNSGAADIVAPLTASAGAVRSGALEESNVEIAREFITLISAATGISSSSRVVRTADELLQELLLLAR